jgi:hypothetical protein
MSRKEEIVREFGGGISIYWSAALIFLVLRKKEGREGYFELMKQVSVTNPD